MLVLRIPTSPFLLQSIFTTNLSPPHSKSFSPPHWNSFEATETHYFLLFLCSLDSENSLHFQYIIGRHVISLNPHMSACIVSLFTTLDFAKIQEPNVKIFMILTFASLFLLEMKGFLISNSWKWHDWHCHICCHIMWQMLYLVMASGELVRSIYIWNTWIVMGSQRIKHSPFTVGKNKT